MKRILLFLSVLCALTFVSVSATTIAPADAAATISSSMTLETSAFDLIKGEQTNGAVYIEGNTSVQYKGNTEGNTNVKFSGDQALSALALTTSTNSEAAGITNSAATLLNGNSTIAMFAATNSAAISAGNSSSGGTATTVTNLKCPTPADGIDTQATSAMTTAYVMKTLMTGAAANLTVDSQATIKTQRATSEIVTTGAVVNTVDYMAKSFYEETPAYANDLAGYSSVANAIILGMISTPASIANDLATGGFTNFSINDANLLGGTNAVVRTSTDIADLVITGATVISTAADATTMGQETISIASSGLSPYTNV